jgi:hypothetical protein
VRQEAIENEFASVPRLIVIGEEVVQWVADGFGQSHADEKRFRDEKARHEAMYEDRLDGRVDAAFFDRKSREWREDQSRIPGRSKTIRLRPNRTGKRRFAFSNSPGTCPGCSQSNLPRKDASFSISWYRTAHGRAVG